MYSIYADGVCFYNDAFALEEMAVFEPKLTLEDCAAGSLRQHRTKPKTRERECDKIDT